MIKIAQNDPYALSFLAKQVLHRNLHIIEGNIRRASRGRIRRLDRLRLDALASLDQKHTESLVGSYSCYEEIRPGAVSNPLLGAIDDL